MNKVISQRWTFVTRNEYYDWILLLNLKRIIDDKYLISVTRKITFKNDKYYVINFDKYFDDIEEAIDYCVIK